MLQYEDVMEFGNFLCHNSEPLMNAIFAMIRETAESSLTPSVMGR